MKTIVIPPEFDNIRADRFFQKQYPSLTNGVIQGAFRKKQIRVNGNRYAPDTPLKTGDTITLYLPDNMLEKKAAKPIPIGLPKPDIVYDKDGVILVNKPRGLLTQGNPDSLELRVQGEFPTAMPANRIDRNTGGIVIFCRDGKTLARIGEEIKDHRIKKSYLLLLQNNPEQPTQQLEQAHIWKDERQAKSYVYPTEKKGTKPIGMYWRTLGKLGEKSEYTLAEAELLTGRTHQIRAHFAYLGYPLVGEGKYAKLKAKSVGQALLSYKTVLADNTEVALDGERITEFFTAYTNGRIDPETITAMLGG